MSSPGSTISLAVLATMAAAVAGCERSPEPKAAHPPQAVMRIDVVRPERQTVRRSVGEPGQLVASEATPMFARIPGYVRAVSVDIGSQVKKGQVLAELRVPELEADARQKRAAIEQSLAKKAQAESAVRVAQSAIVGAEARRTAVRAGTGRAEAELARWQSEAGRVAQLVSDRAVSGSLLDETRSKLRSSESSRDEVQAQVLTAEAVVAEGRAALDQARSDVLAAAATVEVAREEALRAEALLAYAKIEAPFDGVVTHRDVDTGHLTRPGSDGAPLFVVARIDPVTIAVDVPESFATEVNPGDRASVRLQAMKGRIVEGRVTRTAWALDPKTRTIRAEIDLPNPGGLLRPGLYAYATVVVEEHPDVMTIPATAVIPEKDRASCFIVAGGKAVRRAIRTGLGDGKIIEVVSGLDGGEAVVKVGSPSLVDGQPVDPVEVKAPPKP